MYTYLEVIKRKAKVFVDVINAVPDDTVWGIEVDNKDFWRDYKEWNNLKPYLIESNVTFQFVEPDIYILLTDKSKKILTNLLLKDPNALNYFWHNRFFKDDVLYASAIEGTVTIHISKLLNLTIEDNDDWVGYL